MIPTTQESESERAVRETRLRGSPEIHARNEASTLAERERERNPLNQHRPTQEQQQQQKETHEPSQNNQSKHKQTHPTFFAMHEIPPRRTQVTHQRGRAEVTSTVLLVHFCCCPRFFPPSLLLFRSCRLSCHTHDRQGTRTYIQSSVFLSSTEKDTTTTSTRTRITHTHTHSTRSAHHSSKRGPAVLLRFGKNPTFDGLKQDLSWFCFLAMRTLEHKSRTLIDFVFMPHTPNKTVERTSQNEDVLADRPTNTQSSPQRHEK